MTKMTRYLSITLKKFTVILSLGLISQITYSQNTGGVFGPVVNEGHRALEYRATYAQESDGLSQRIHYQQSLDTKIMWRVVIGTRKTDESASDFDSARGELFWQLTEDHKSYQTGVRFDLVTRDDNRPNTFGLNWMNQFKLNESWSSRLLLLTSSEFGEQKRDGIFLQSRAQVNKKLKSNFSTGIELYSSYGSTEDFSDTDEQIHQIGPYIRLPAAKSLSIYGNILFGITSATSDTEFRIWITKNW